MNHTVKVKPERTCTDNSLSTDTSGSPFRGHSDDIFCNYTKFRHAYSCSLKRRAAGSIRPGTELRELQVSAPGSCKSRGRVDATQAIPRIQFTHGVLATKRTLCVTAFDQWLGLCQGCSREDFGSGSLKTSFCTMVSRLSFICVNFFLAQHSIPTVSGAGFMNGE
jgi:hypothetical protein